MPDNQSINGVPLTNQSQPAPQTAAVPSPSSQNTIDQIPNPQSVVEILYNKKVINPGQYEAIKVKSASEGSTPDSVLEEMKIVSGEKFAEAKAELLGIPFVSLANTSFSPQVLNLIPRAVAERFSVIPFGFDPKTKILSIAMGNPADLDAIQFIRQKTGLNIQAFATSPTDVSKAIFEQYRQELVGEVGEALKETEVSQEKTKTISSSDISKIITDAPIAKIVSTILDYAVTSNASDVHIEPQEDRVRVRYRIDGILYDKLSLPKGVQDALVSRTKILAELKIDEHRIPQDGRFNFKVFENEVDLRISILPTVFGEKIVIRLLRKSGGVPSLPELGLNGVALRSLEASILRPHGIILVCGPTGSGKTTTLYSVLSRLNTTRVNILSLEDPVEYQIPGINQVQINPAVGLTFATGLRAFLRQDPNIILVGEIRDEETTELALQAALTGHLVFSTLHTSGASGALPRLIDLGAEPFLLSSTVNALVGQRIVRKICPDCKQSYVPPSPLIDEIKKELGKLFLTVVKEPLSIKLYKGKGCVECNSTGYKGRIGIFEVLPVTEKIAQDIITKSDANTIQAQAVQDGMITMKQDGYLKVLQGVTTIEEVLRVAQN